LYDGGTTIPASCQHLGGRQSAKSSAPLRTITGLYGLSALKYRLPLFATIRNNPPSLAVSDFLSVEKTMIAPGKYPKYESRQTTITTACD